MFNEDKTIAAAQKVMLEMLLEVHRICVENNITYWLEGGTLLGALRHKGFIPWDDDIDISMPRKDYERFLKVAEKELDAKYFLQTRDIEPAFPWNIAKIRKHNTLLIETGENGDENYHHGIFIDIIPNDFYDSIFFVKWMRWGVLAREKRKDYLRGSIKRIMVTLYVNIILCLPLEFTKCVRLYFSKHKDWFSNRDAKYLTHPLDFGCLHFTKTKDILPVEKRSFEGFEFYVPNNPEEYLSSYYDENWMVLPPEEKRICHHQKIKF